MRAPLLYPLVLAGTMLLACSDDKGSGTASSSSTSSSSSTGGAGSPPDPSTLFDALKPASPDKLRGVWETKDTDAAGSTITIRLRFTDSYLGGLARCTSSAGKSLDAPNVVGIDTADLDKKDGVFAMPDGIAFSAADGDFKCTASLPGGNIKFAIAGAKLSLSLDGEDGALDFTKVGD